MKDVAIKFQVPKELHDLKEGAKVKLPYYCKADNCNVKKPVEDAIKTKGAMAAMLAKHPKGATGKPGEKPEGKPEGENGAAQTTVAVATIALSMVMARLAL